MDNKTNGRVDIIYNNSCFTHSDRIPAKEPASFREALTGTWDNTKLSVLFFSQENQKIIQNGIRAGVYKLSNGLYNIGEQDYDVLKIIMRSTFLQYSANNEKNITKQVEELNKLVLDYCVKQVHGEAQGYIQYKFDSSTLAVPLSYPIMSQVDSKELIYQTRY